MNHPYDDLERWNALRELGFSIFSSRQNALEMMEAGKLEPSLDMTEALGKALGVHQLSVTGPIFDCDILERRDDAGSHGRKQYEQALRASWEFPCWRGEDARAIGAASRPLLYQPVCFESSRPRVLSAISIILNCNQKGTGIATSFGGMAHI
jgi:hypothetical protein